MTEMHALVVKGAEANGVTPREFNGLLPDRSVLSEFFLPHDLSFSLPSEHAFCFLWLSFHENTAHS